MSALCTCVTSRYRDLEDLRRLIATVGAMHAERLSRGEDTTVSAELLATLWHEHAELVAVLGGAPPWARHVVERLEAELRATGDTFYQAVS